MILLIVGANVGAYQLPDVKIDLSQNKINSLSEFSKKTIRELPGEVEVKLFISSELPPEVRPIYTNLTTILKSLANINKGKFKLVTVDPMKDESAREEASRYGIQELQFSSIKSDKFEIQKGYFGLAMKYNGKSEVLPVAGDVGNIEYLVISAVKRLVATKLPTVLVAEDAILGYQSQTRYLQQFLQQAYTVKEAVLDGDTVLDESASALIIVGRSTKIDDKGLGKIKKWIDSGKSTLVLLDRYEVDQSMLVSKNPETGLEKLIEGYGFKLGNGLVMSDNGAIANFKTQKGNYVVRYPYWLQLSSNQIDRSNPIFSGINLLLIPWASPVEVSNDVQPFMWTDLTAKVDDEPKNLSPAEVKKTTEEGKKIVLGGLKNDKVKLAVVGDKDFISDQFVVNSQQNLGMMMNLVDYLAGDSGIYQIRNKNVEIATIAGLTDKARNLVKYTNMILPGVILGVIYLVVNARRRR